jgi:hypothetical protein
VDNQVEFVKKATGVLVTTKKGDVIKIVPPCYNNLRNLRGNDPSLEKRMAVLWRDDIRRYIEQNLTDGEDSWSCMKFLDLFPEKQAELTEVFSFLQTVAPVRLGDFFMKRYQKNLYLHLDKPIHTILEASRKYYKSEFSVEDNIRYQMSKVPFYILMELLGARNGELFYDTIVLEKNDLGVTNPPKEECLSQSRQTKKPKWKPVVEKVQVAEN